MSGSHSGRFKAGQSGNPKGRPKARRPHVSAFDVIFDKTLNVTQNGAQRELTIDEALQLQTYQAALGGSKMAIRQVLKMIEKREVALAKRNPSPVRSVRVDHEHDSDNADEAMCLLGITEREKLDGAGDSRHDRLKVSTWAAQAAISRPGRRKFSQKDTEDIHRLTMEPGKLKWPRGTAVE